MPFLRDLARQQDEAREAGNKSEYEKITMLTRIIHRPYSATGPRVV